MKYVLIFTSLSIKPYIYTLLTFSAHLKVEDFYSEVNITNSVFCDNQEHLMSMSCTISGSNIGRSMWLLNNQSIPVTVLHKTNQNTIHGRFSYGQSTAKVSTLILIIKNRNQVCNSKGEGNYTCVTSGTIGGNTKSINCPPMPVHPYIGCKASLLELFMHIYVICIILVIVECMTHSTLWIIHLPKSS